VGDRYPYPGKKLHTILVTPERREGRKWGVTSIVVTGQRGGKRAPRVILPINRLISKVSREILHAKPSDLEGLPADLADQTV
jgi:hypothetical protein